LTPHARSEPNRWLILALLALAQFVVVLDASIVNVALPSIGEELKIDQESLSWIVNAYVLTFGGFLLLGGRAADLLGRKALFIGGLVLFGFSSLAGGFATDETQLVIARAVQGLGAAILSPAALAIVTTTFTEGADRNRALGVWGAVAGSGGAVGVLLGGALTEGPGWEWVLWINFPICLAAAAGGLRLLSESRGTSVTRHFDLLGAVTVTSGLSLLVFALVDAASAGWASRQTICLILGALGLLTAFVGFELRSAAPLVPFRIFRQRTLTGANVAGLLMGASLFSMFFLLSLYMQQVLGYSALKAGLSYAPLSFTIILVAGLGSQLVTRIGFKPVLAAGLGLHVIGMLWFAQVSADGTYLADILGPSLLCAVGLALSFVAVTIAAVHGVAHQDSGLASGLINTVQQVGAALGVAVLTAVAIARTDSFSQASGAGPGPPSREALTEGFQAAFLTGAGFALAGMLATLLIIRHADSRATVGAAHPVPA
jgi:EmrB/QacA subfamily drug resistance transporter